MHNQKSSACATHHIFHNTNNILYLYRSDLKVDLGQPANCKVMYFLHTYLFLLDLSLLSTLTLYRTFLSLFSFQRFLKHSVDYLLTFTE